DSHQLFRLDRRLVMRALGTIGAVFRAAAGLDRDQSGNLHLGGIEVQAVNALRAEDEFGEGKLEQPAHLCTRPVVTDDAVLTRLARSDAQARTVAMDPRKSKRAGQPQAKTAASSAKSATTRSG